MKWTIAQLGKYRENGLEFDEVIQVSEQLQRLDSTIRKASPMQVQGRADIDMDEATFHLQITGNLILPCSRTLEDVEFPVNIFSTETFILNPLNNHVDEENESVEVHEVKGGTIDLLPIIHELILLEIPIQVLSKEAKESATMPIGQGWEVLTEDQLQVKQEREKKNKIDPRLADLAQLLENNEDDKENK